MILEPPVLVGHKYTLRCYVTHVFPVGFLVVSLRRGGRVIHFESLERYTTSYLANVTLTHVMRAGPNDLLQPLTCHARLNLDGLVVSSSSAPVMLTVLGEAPATPGVGWGTGEGEGVPPFHEGLQNRPGLRAWRSSDLPVLIFTLAPSFEPSRDSLGLYLHRSRGGGPPGCGDRLLAQVSGPEDTVIDRCSMPDEKEGRSPEQLIQSHSRWNNKAFSLGLGPTVLGGSGFLLRGRCFLEVLCLGAEDL